MNNLKEKIANISTAIEEQLPYFVVENNPKFVSFLNSYYESQETKFNSLDLVQNLIEYYNISEYSPSSLIKNTKLTSAVSSSSVEIEVSSTLGFPEQNGYVMIDDEIIFYKNKTNTRFLECVRGTGAFILQRVPFNQITYKQGSNPSSHAVGKSVINIASYFVDEFLRRIKSEISPILPQKLSEDLNIITFLKNIKSFYSTKGSQFSHKILFRILFNDKTVKLRLRNSGTGAKIEILNYNGTITETSPISVGSTTQTKSIKLTSGGSNYYYETVNSELVGEPIIEILGSGTGSPIELNTISATGDGSIATLTFNSQPVAPFKPGATIIVSGITPSGYNGTYTVINCTRTSVSYSNTTTDLQSNPGRIKSNVIPNSASLKVTSMTGSNGYGSIEEIQLTNPGKGYIGPITARIRDRNFIQDQLVRCLNDSNEIIGVGRVYSWNSSSRELILYDVKGYFAINYRIIGEGGEDPRARISLAYPATDLNKEGNPSIEINSNDPEIELPRNYVIKPSAAQFYKRTSIKCEYISGPSNLDNVSLLELVQSSDKTYNIPGVSISVSSIYKITNNLYEFDVEQSIDYKKLFLPASAIISNNATVLSTGNGITLTVGNTKNFPPKNGRLYILGRIIEYATKTSTQFLNCKLIEGSTSLTVPTSTVCYLFGRRCTPNHISYFIKGYINGDRTSEPVIFRLMSMPSEVKITNGASLYSSSLFNFTNPKLKAGIKSKLYKFGNIDEVIIENPGSNYKVFDKVITDSSSIIGSGFYAYVSEVTGKTVSSYTLTERDGKKYIKITTSTAHNLSSEDVVIFNNAAIKTQRVFSVESDTQFLIPRPSSFNTTTASLSYTTRSKTASGSIVKISISNKGNNYEKLPPVLGIESVNGTNAIIQLNSSNIGKISSLEYSYVEGELVGDKETQYSIKFPSTAKIKENFQVSKIIIENGGNNYRATDTIKVNGVVDPTKYEFKIVTSAGVLTEIQVIKGGSNLKEIPDIEIESNTGSGAILKAEILRKPLYENDILYFGSYNNPTGTAKVVYFDNSSSTLEFERISGNINPNDTIYYSDSSVYGKIFSIRIASAYSTPSAYVQYPHTFLDNYGFLNDYNQRVHDSDYYQDWSYTIAANKNTIEWKNEVIQNTHPAGFKVFGKNLLHNRKSFFESKEIFNSSVLLKATFKNIARLNLKLANCKTQKIHIENANEFAVGDFIYGSNSGAKGIVKEVGINYLIVYLYNTKRTFDTITINSNENFYELKINGNDVTENFPLSQLELNITVNNNYVLPNTKYFLVSNGIYIYNLDNLDKAKLNIYQTGINFYDNVEFVIGDHIFQVTDQFTFENISNTKNNIAFYDGILQNPNESYLISDSTFIPKFDIDYTKHAIFHKLTTPFDILDYNIVNNNTLKLSKNYVPFFPSNNEKLLISIDGVLQAPNTFTVSGDIVQLSENVTNLDNIFILHQPNLKALTFTGSGTNYTLNYTPNSACKLIIFTNGVYQSQLVTNYSVTSNQLILDEVPDSNNLFGWYIDETTVNCYLVNFSNFKKNRIRNFNSCSPKLFTTRIESNYEKQSSSIFELTKDFADGTVYADPSSKFLYGFDTKFTYTYPEYSSSYVEVLNPITTFDGTTKSFTLRYRDNLQYTPFNGKTNLMVYIDGLVLDSDLYSVSGSTITFTQAYTSSNKCTIIDFISKYIANTTSSAKGASLDRLNVSQNGTRTTFNLSDRGVPQYVKNIGDLFVIKNGALLKPDSTNQSVSQNKITLQTAPTSTDLLNILFFNRQLSPVKTKNVVLDPFVCFDGVRTSYPLSIDGIYIDKLFNYTFSVYHLFVVRNGVHQKPSIDYTITTNSIGTFINFTTAPVYGETVFVYYSYDSLTQNFIFDTFKKFDGIQDKFSLTKDYISIDPLSSSHIQVFRNNVYQYPGVDYNIGGGSGYKYIDFATPPVASDDIYITNYSTSDLVDVTSRFAQETTSSLKYTSQTPTVDTDVFLIYVNGILQDNTAWNFNTSTNILSFTGTSNNFVSLTLDKVKILAFQTKKRVLDEIVLAPLDTFKLFNGTNDKFALTKNYIKVNIISPEHVQVIKNGVYQYPTTDYAITTSQNSKFIIDQDSADYIDFTVPPVSTDTFNIRNIKTDDIVDVTSRFSQLSSNSFQYTATSPTVNTNVFLVYKNKILLSNESWVFSNNVLTFTQNINKTNDNVKIYAFKTQKPRIDSFDIVEIDQFKYFNSVNTDFALTDNYINVTVTNTEDLHVFRNGVYQYEATDYTLHGTTGSQYIKFSTAPNSTETVSIINYSNNDILDITSRFTQLTTNSLQYTESGTSVDKTVFLIYLNGIPQVNSWTYNTGTNVLTFDENISLINDKIKIFAFVSAKSQLDSITIQNNVSIYTLKKNNVNITSNLTKSTDLIVIMDGVVQIPEISYTVSGNQLTLVNSNTNVGSVLTIYNLGPNYQATLLDNIDDNFSKTTFKLQNDFKYYPIFSNNNLLVIKNNVTLTPTTDFVTDDGYITFNSSITQSDTINIYVKQYVLTSNGTPLSTNLPQAQDLLITINNSIITPTTTYTISNNIINFINVTNYLTYRVHTFQISSTNQTETLDYINDNYSKNTYKLSSNYVYYNKTTSGDIFVYKNGVLLTSTTDYTYGNGYITFTTNITSTDQIYIGHYEYNLLKNNSIISSDLPVAEENLMLIVNGVVQNPNTYTLTTGNVTTGWQTIKLNNAPELVNPSTYETSSVYIYQVGKTDSDIILVDYLNDDFSKPKYKLQTNYKSFNAPSQSDVFVIRNGVPQNPGQDYIIGNGYIEFTTNISELDDVFIMYRHGSSELEVQNITNNIITLTSSVPSSKYNNIVVYLNGVPQFNGFNFDISGQTITLDSTPTTVDSLYVIEYANITFYDPVDDCPDGSRTKFRLLDQGKNLVAADVASNADILVSKNEVILYPGIEYTLTTARGMIEFTTPPSYQDDIFRVRMYGNELVTLTPVSNSTTVFDLNQTISTQYKEDLVIFSNNSWNFSDLNNFTYNTESRITLSTPKTSQYIFGIKFSGLLRLLDQINTPFNGSNNKFNMFLSQENFIPYGTIENDAVPSETAILVIKNGKILDPGIDYTLQGDIKSQVQFTTAPISTDVISIRTVGAFLKLQSVTSGFGGKNYNLKKQNNTDYYPNSDISRPREHENQILVIKDGNIQSPLYDYYIDNNKLVFANNVTATKLVILDFRGTISDVKVDNYYHQIAIGETIFVDGEQNDRIVDKILSPTVIETKEIIKNGNLISGKTYIVREIDGTVPSLTVGSSFVATSSVKSGLKTCISTNATIEGKKSSGFTATSTIANGKLTGITITNGGSGYRYPVVLRSLGGGVGAKAIANVNRIDGNKVTTPIEIQYSGYNQYQTQTILPTSYAYYYRKRPLNTSSVKIGTKLSSAINSSTEIIPISNGENFEQSDIVINLTCMDENGQSYGSGATFRPFISNGRIRKIEVLTSGSGYDDRFIKVFVTGGGGSGCVLEPILNSSGSVTSINVKNPGEGYDTYRIIINYEVIEYTKIISNTSLVGCTRSSSSTSHTANSIVFYDKFI